MQENNLKYRGTGRLHTEPWYLLQPPETNSVFYIYPVDPDLCENNQTVTNSLLGEYIVDIHTTAAMDHSLQGGIDR